MEGTAAAFRCTCVFGLLQLSTALQAPAGTTLATFGNQQTKQLIKTWAPRPLDVPSGSTLLPASQENMKRFVRARILLEDPSVGCVALYDESLCVILCRFSKAEHALLLPLWGPGATASQTFQQLKRWHKQAFDPSRLSGKTLEWPEDRAVWAGIQD
jgi:hypothetical protein